MAPPPLTSYLRGTSNSVALRARALPRADHGKIIGTLILLPHHTRVPPSIDDLKLMSIGTACAGCSLNGTPCPSGSDTVSRFSVPMGSGFTWGICDDDTWQVLVIHHLNPPIQLHRSRSYAAYPLAISTMAGDGKVDFSYQRLTRGWTTYFYV
jgi:hypothetical protein